MASCIYTSSNCACCILVVLLLLLLYCLMQTVVNFHTHMEKSSSTSASDSILWCCCKEEEWGDRQRTREREREQPTITDEIHLHTNCVCMCSKYVYTFACSTQSAVSWLRPTDTHSVRACAPSVMLFSPFLKRILYSFVQTKTRAIRYFIPNHLFYRRMQKAYGINDYFLFSTIESPNTS